MLLNSNIAVAYTTVNALDIFQLVTNNDNMRVLENAFLFAFFKMQFLQ